jgi:predicted NUDIX family NTP pyrophosphohydrolase
MAAPLSAGILMWRRRANGLEVLLAHFGGPQWRNRDEGAWGIPKGLAEEGEDPAACARREFEEELGVAPQGELVPLGRVRYKSGKWIEAFALEGDLDAARIVSNTFTTEWPPRSGRVGTYPEVDRAAWFGLGEARAKMLPAQRPLIDLVEKAVPNPPRNGEEDQP